MSLDQVFVEYSLNGQQMTYLHTLKEPTYRRETQHSKRFICVTVAMSNALNVLAIKAGMKV